MEFDVEHFEYMSDDNLQYEDIQKMNSVDEKRSRTDLKKVESLILSKLFTSYRGEVVQKQIKSKRHYNLKVLRNGLAFHRDMQIQEQRKDKIDEREKSIIILVDNISEEISRKVHEMEESSE